MGKKDKKKGQGAAKTAAKTEKKADQKLKKELRAKGEDDVVTIISKIQETKKQRLEVSEEVSPFPSARSSFSFTVHPERDELILYGGEYCNGHQTFVYGDLYFYNIKRNVWTLVNAPNSPPPRCSHQAVALPQNGGQLWVFGGEFSSLTQSQFYHYKDLWVFHFHTRSWEKINAAGGPSARSGHRMVHTKKQLIVFGGFYDNGRVCKYYNDAYAFNLESYTWNPLSCRGTAPSPRSGCQMAALSSGKILVLGGYSKEQVKKEVEKGHTHSDMFLLQPDKGDNDTGLKWHWTVVKQSGLKPSPRCGCTLIAVPSSDRAFMFGGVFDQEEDEESLRGSFYNDLYSLNTDRGIWSVVTVSERHADVARKRRRRAKETGEVPEVEDDDEGTEEEEEEEIVEELKDKLLVVGEKSTEEEEEEKKTTYSDGVFTVTVGPDNSAASGGGHASCSFGASSETFVPHPRMNCGLALKHGVLYLFGGIFEDGDRSVTIPDLHSLDIHKLDKWQTLEKYDVEEQEWFDDTGSSEDDDDDDEEQVIDEEMDSENDTGSDVDEADTTTPPDAPMDV